MSQNQYFRVGAGSVIYNAAGEIALFLRTGNPTLWQLQQGGRDPNETTEETLWRELREETGIQQTNIEKVDLYPDWLLYEYHDQIRPKLNDQNCVGQIHKWYFLKLKPGVLIDLKNATDKEFSEVKWSSFQEVLRDSNNFKYPVYKKLAEYFTTHIS
ncbi:MAG TPA: NUDIX domain-containing protein [Candidatus Paceibacterota bacterium]|nr:NUDIX domain-containing protein [Candidatus Paceibacterota bacterium]